MTTLVSVGNARQPFERLLDAVAAVLEDLPAPVIVQHGHTPFQTKTAIARPFLEMTEFAQLVDAAGLLIMHAGAGSLLYALQSGKTPVVMPRRAAHREHVDDHQTELASELARRGSIILVNDANELRTAVLSLLGKARLTPSVKEAVLVDLVRERLDDYARQMRRRGLQGAT